MGLGSKLNYADNDLLQMEKKVGDVDYANNGCLQEQIGELSSGIELLNAELDSKVDISDSRLSDARTPKSHAHDERYYTESEINNLLSGKASSSHTHTKAQVGLGDVDNTSDANKSVNYATSAGSVTWGNVSGKPNTFTPATHTHDDRYYTKSQIKPIQYKDVAIGFTLQAGAKNEYSVAAPSGTIVAISPIISANAAWITMGISYDNQTYKLGLSNNYSGALSGTVLVRFTYI